MYMYKLINMNKKIMLASILVIASLSIFAQDGKSKRMDSTTHKVYTCTMHPEVISDKPGKCPKCGMDLVEKKNTKAVKEPGPRKMTMQKKDSTMAKKKIAS
jgi:hypothetical protein